MSVPTLSMVRPKLTARASAGGVGEIQVALVHPEAGGIRGLCVQ
jgi:hypothetical protein